MFGDFMGGGAWIIFPIIGIIFMGLFMFMMFTRGAGFMSRRGDHDRSPREHSPEARQSERADVSPGSAEIAMPQPQAIEAVTGQNAPVEIASTGRHHAFHLFSCPGYPANAIGRANHRVVRDGIAVGRVP